MFTIPDTRLSASNSALLASETFIVPMTLRVTARTLQAASGGLQHAYEEVKSFIPRLAGTAPGISLVGFEEPVPPRVSRVDVVRHGKEYRFNLTFALRCPIPKEQDFWARIQFIATVYDRLAELVASFDDRKDVHFYLEEARLSQQKEDPERLRVYRK